MDDFNAPNSDIARFRLDYLRDFAMLDASQQAEHFVVTLLAIGRAVAVARQITIHRCTPGDHRPQLK